MGRLRNFQTITISFLQIVKETYIKIGTNKEVKGNLIYVFETDGHKNIPRIEIQIISSLAVGINVKLNTAEANCIYVN